jgi:hypothetical protein
MYFLFSFSIIAGLVLLMPSLRTDSISIVSRAPSPALKNAIKKQITLSDYTSEKFSFIEADLNDDGKKETIAILHNGFDCNNRHCTGFIFKNSTSRENYKLISKFHVARGGNVFISSKSSHSHKDIVASTFFYAPKRIEYRAWKFDGAKYEYIDKILPTSSENAIGKAIFTEDNLSFDLK